MHPPRMSAPSCIVPPTEQLVIRPHIVPLLPTFHAKENEKFYECWERYMEAINACPHHGFDTWLLASYFYGGMSFLNEATLGNDVWRRLHEEVGKMNSQPSVSIAKVGMYTLSEDTDMKVKFTAMARRLEELKIKKIHKAEEGESSQMRKVKAMITLRSGKEVDLLITTPEQETEREIEEEKKEKFKGKRPRNNTKKEDHDLTVKEGPERDIAKEDMRKNHMPPPFP
ncbi:hypothetical protein CK203_106895 [Vitis vinifera]|uniref:Retrotransposon gag domain-containing protein n=1 Tax=Vitis vinifera TaxID=29760 RepID=A0A438C5I4_VITVI|nr:hypothetical protein CK203_106895 [Vitis vinifera]